MWSVPCWVVRVCVGWAGPVGLMCVWGGRERGDGTNNPNGSITKRGRRTSTPAFFAAFSSFFSCLSVHSMEEAPGTSRKATAIAVVSIHGICSRHPMAACGVACIPESEWQQRIPASCQMTGILTKALPALTLSPDWPRFSERLRDAHLQRPATQFLGSQVDPNRCCKISTAITVTAEWIVSARRG